MPLTIKLSVQTQRTRIAQLVQQQATCWMASLRFLAEARNFVFYITFKQALESTQPAMQRVPGAVFPEGKVAGS
jgi:hypothetical protein